MAQLGFVFWGLRNGFSNHLFSSNVDPTLPSHFTDDMRQICQGTIDAFYSIEKISNFTLLTTYNPNTKDNFGRRGYTALSLVIPNGYSTTGNPLELLNRMMETYVTRQGNAMVTMVRIEDFQSLLDKVPLVRTQGEISHERKRIGLCYYQNDQELFGQLSKPDIYQFSKVYYAKSQNAALDRLSGIENVQTFQKPLFLQLSNFDPKWRAFKNGSPITSTRTPIKPGDTLLFQDAKTGRRKEYIVENTDIHLSGNDLFPPVVKPPKQSNEGNSKILLIVSACVLLLGVGGYFLYPYIFPTTDTPPPPPPPPVEELSMEYDYSKIKFVGDTKNLTDSSYLIVNQDEGKFASWTKSDGQISVIDWNEFKGFDNEYYLKSVTDSILDTLMIKQVGTKPVEHKVAKGDLISNIAMRYGLDPSELVELNPELEDPDKLAEDVIIRLVPEEKEKEQEEDPGAPRGPATEEAPKDKNAQNGESKPGNSNSLQLEDFDTMKDRIQGYINSIPDSEAIKQTFQIDINDAGSIEELEDLEKKIPKMYKGPN